MNTAAPVIGAAVGSVAGYLVGGRSFWWAFGGALAGSLAGAAVANAATEPFQIPPPGDLSPPSNAPRIITLSPGTISVIKTAPGTAFEVALPSGASWLEPLFSGDTNANVGSAPSAGSNPAGFVYSGGGGTLEATWVDSSGNAQTTTITVSSP